MREHVNPRSVVPKRTILLVVTFVGLVLAALVLVPLETGRRSSQITEKISRYAEPADSLAAGIQSALSHSMSGIVGFQTTGRPEYQALYYRNKSSIDKDLAELEPLARALGGGAYAGYERLRTMVELWHAEVMAAKLLTDSLEAGEFRRALYDHEHVLEQSHDAATSFQHNIHRMVEQQRAELHRLDRANVALSVILSCLVLATIVGVGWLAHRVSKTNERLWLMSQEDSALREISANLAATRNMPELLKLITEKAREIGGADGTFLEKVHLQTNEIEVAAGSGTNIPTVGQRFTSDSCVTELLQQHEYRVIENVRSVNRPIFECLSSKCRNCAALLVPVLGDGATLGSLVLLKSSGTFSDDEIRSVRLLADMAAVAVKQISMLEQAENSRNDAHRAVQVRDEVLKIVSHDLRNPLNSISVTTTMLTDPRLARKDQERLAEIMKRSVRRMDRLIQDLLDAARIQGHMPLPLDPAEHDLRQLLDEACELTRINAQRKSVEVKCEGPLQLPRVFVDYHRVLQVLMNITDNAVKFTPEGGVVTIRCEVRDTETQFSVSDTGPGIREEDLPRVFEMYWQQRGAALLGTGLGLGIAKTIVENHGGRIWVHSIPGRGTTFFFTLPRKERQYLVKDQETEQKAS